MIDVAHDGDHRWTGAQLVLGVHGDLGRVQIGCVFLFFDSLETELPGDELDLVEVQALIDGDHQPQVLEREPDDLDRGNLENLRQLADGDELVHVNGLLLALGLGLLLRGDLLAIGSILGATRSTAADRSAHGGHRLSNVRRHCFLIYSTLALFSASRTAVVSAATSAPTATAVISPRRSSACSGSGGRDRTRRRVRRAGGDRTWPWRAGNDRLWTLAIARVSTIGAVMRRL